MATTVKAESEIEHFKVWLTPEHRFIDENRNHPELKDQFHENEFEKVIDKLKWIANPTRKNGRIRDLLPPIAHLTGYSIRKPEKGEDEQPTRTVTFMNQLRDKPVTWEIKEIEYLLLPAWKLADKDKDKDFPKELPKTIDHYLCYAAEGEPVEKETTLQDQFDTIAGREETVTKLTPRFFGVPAQKNGSQFVHRDAHLAIYEIEPAKGIEAIQISTDDQFKTWRNMTITKPQYLAVPTDKLGWVVGKTPT
jgi:hypothetical protein